MSLGACKSLTKMGKWRQSLEEYRDKLGNNNLTNVIISIQDFCGQREAISSTQPCKRPCLIRSLMECYLSFQSLGGDECELLPKNEDIPVTF
jgi:hypothetical protein